MANLRPVLLISLLFLGYLIWVEWQKDYGPQPQPQSTPVAETAPANPASIPDGGDLPDVSAAAPGDLPATPAPGTSVTENSATATGSVAAPQRPLIAVRTDVLDLEIDPLGGSVVSARLLDYPVDLDEPDVKVTLLNQGLGRYHIAQSGLLSAQEAPNHTTVYVADATEYELADGQDRLEVPLSWRGENGVTVTKTFVFERGEYAIGVSHAVDNRGAAPWTGSRYLQLQKSPPGEGSGAGFNNPERYSFDGVGFYNPEDKLEKVDFDDAVDEPYRATSADGWLSMIQHYFFTAWVPPAGEPNAYSTQPFTPNGTLRVIARAVSPQVTVASGQQHTFESTLYVGPKIQDHLADIAPGLELTVNYGIFTVFSAPLFWLLSKIHDFVGNWGWSIVLLTILIKLAFFKLTEAQYRSMARMRKLQPRMEKLKERYGDDRQALSQAMMKMYKEEKVNPLGGCLPILVQIPIFIALYWVLLESVELRQAPFILWIDNLSVRDPYFILPALNAVFMFATQRLTPMVGMDPLQQKMMQAMPLVFSIMFAFFPAGLVLYWATNAGLSLAQQWYITRKIAAEP
ncbi:MAG: membrane protein insertase YidC [Xanthomonadales bacterium]|nr:membrane protein insertase YidC [Xanthomonadales bacterium]